MVETSKKEGWRITEWHLVMPLDLTNQNLGWLDSYVADADFPCETHGLLLCDTLAANYPKVIDYYLRDGKERLQAEMDNLTRILSGRLNRQENEPLDARRRMTDLTSIYKALNACDPFYKYNFGVSDDPPPDEPSPDEEGLVAVYAMRQDSVWITIKIYALSLASLEERPITWRLQLAVPADDDELREQVQKFIDYGAPLSMPEGTVSGSLDLPGGLGGDLSGASLQVSNVIEQQIDDERNRAGHCDARTRLRHRDRQHHHQADRIQSGQGGGFRSIWVDNANLFTIEMLARNTSQRELTWNFHVEYDLNGRRPADLVDSLKFLAAMHAPNRIGIGLTYGPREFSSGGTASSADRDREAKRWSVIADALARIQDHVAVRLRMPAEMTKDQAIAIIEAAKLVSGEAITGTMSGSFTVEHQETQIEPETGQALRVRRHQSDQDHIGRRRDPGRQGSTVLPRAVPRNRR